MVAKKTTKTKKSIKKKSNKESAAPRLDTDRSVRIEKATNGFMVSSWLKNKEVRYIAKNKKEAMGYAEDIFAKF